MACCTPLLFADVAIGQSGSMSTQRPLRVLVDPGHGGQDAGAMRGDIKEADITLKLAQKLKSVLEERGFKVTLTRDRDATVSLENRAQVANNGEHDLLLSLHLNSSPDSRAKGKEFYFQNQLPVDEESMFLASQENSEISFSAGAHHVHHHAHDHEASALLESSMRNTNDRIESSGVRQAESRALPSLDRVPESARRDVKRILSDLSRQARVEKSSALAVELHRAWRDSSAIKQKSRGSQPIRQAPFFLVSYVAIPSVLVEVGFLSHKVEGPELTTEAYQATLVQSIADGLSGYQRRER